MKPSEMLPLLSKLGILSKEVSAASEELSSKACKPEMPDSRQFKGCCLVAQHQQSPTVSLRVSSASMLVTVCWDF